MPILVTGVTGLLGNNVVRALLEQGETVRVLARQNCDPRPLEGLDVEVVRGDLRQADQVHQACRGVRAVVHSAAHVHIGWSGLEIARQVNVEGTRHVAAAARDAGVKMIHVSSVDALGVGSPDTPANEESPVQGKVQCPYVVTKRESEQVVLEAVDQGLDACIVNPGFMLGPWDWKPSSGRMLLEVARRFTPAAPTGGCSACDVRDVAAGILAALDQGQSGRRYILAGENISYFDLWELFAEVTGSKPPRMRFGPLMRALGGGWGDFMSKLTGREGDVNSAAIAMSSLFNYYSSDRAKAELGYQPRALRSSVEDAWQWFLEHGFV